MTSSMNTDNLLVKHDNLSYHTNSVKNNIRILDIKTSQTYLIKELVKGISKNIIFCDIVFVSPDQSCENNVIGGLENNVFVSPDESCENILFGGLVINALSDDKTLFFNLILDAINFDYFSCSRKFIPVTLDLRDLYSKLKMIDNDYPIIMYINNDCESTLHIEGQISSNVKIEFQVFIFDSIIRKLCIPKISFQNKITMSSDVLYKICKNISKYSPIIEITAINNEIKFNEIKFSEINYNENANYDNVTFTYENNKNEPVLTFKNTFMVKDLLKIIKWRKISSTIDIYMKDDNNLNFLVTNIGCLGRMQIIMLPISN